MSPTEALPLLVVVVLLVSASGATVEEMDVTFDGDHAVESIDDVLVVAGGTTTVPADAALSGDVYVTGGTVQIDGPVDGDVTLLAGNLSVGEGATVTGSVETIAGDPAIAESASVGRVSTFGPPAPADSPARQVATFLVQFLLLGAVGWWLARRHPALLENVGHSVTDHPLVSGVIGSLAGTTLLVLFVYMAFTLVLLPVSILGLLAELLVVLYSQVVLGYLVGRRLPVADAGRATVVGVGAFLLAMELLGYVPVLGAVVQFALVVVGLGAVLNSYFGLQRFEPVTIPGEVD
ncbi:polymer-forming cytoskeletal protein [Halobacterium wangiae]|uniref:polymer-forming cytoskeletal protein n=1 Tax=Halobacterium wangiae TaxID=2902623 RepID=UPI001E4462D1|nr:polymer-forming cytoskeletal protein [Halobacterium wangiae]